MDFVHVGALSTLLLGTEQMSTDHDRNLLV